MLDNAPILNSYLRFDVQGLTGSITSATLRIYANSSSSTGYTVHAVTDNTWTETGITYSNAPTMGSQLGSSGTFSANTWTTVDVTSYITGNGTYNFAFTTTSNTNISFSSREGANAPELVIVTSGSATNTPTPTNTPGPTSTPTRTPTPGASNTPTVPPTVTPTTQPVFSSATFIYDGDGKRVKSTINNTITTYFVGAHFELTGSTVTKYYYAGAQRIALRTGSWDHSNPVTGTLNFMMGDHLGSTSLTTDASGNKVSEIRYKAWGTIRYATEGVPTKYQYTGQFSYEAEFGLYFYNARWYDSSLGRFAQADTIIPDPYNPQAYDRYAYTFNNPLLYTDPTGHDPILDFVGGFLKELARTNFWFHPGYQKDLAIKNNESTAELTGRLVADVVSMAIGVVEAGGGTGVAGGGVAVCVTGVGCLAGAPAVASGGVLIAQGAGTTLSAANGFGTTLAMLSKGSGSGSGDQSRIKAQLEKSINSLEQRLTEHEAKLADYIENPDAFDNRGFLANAPNQAIREAIIERRIAHLQNDINNFRKQIADLQRQLKRMEQE